MYLVNWKVHSSPCAIIVVVQMFLMISPSPTHLLSFLSEENRLRSFLLRSAACSQILLLSLSDSHVSVTISVSVFSVIMW